MNEDVNENRKLIWKKVSNGKDEWWKVAAE